MVRPENMQINHYKAIVRAYLRPEEIKALQEKSDWHGAWEVLQVWLWIAGAMALVGLCPNVFTVIIALFIIGGKQLGCAIIMHDTSHYSLFKTRKLNEWIGNWLGAYPIFQNVTQYRPYHFEHHIATGTADDPDINLTMGYPTTGMSMFRKFIRDLAGASGIKGFFGVIMMHLGYLKYNLGNRVEKVKALGWSKVMHNAWRNLRGPVAFHLLFFGLLWAIGQPWLYVLWWVSFFTTYNLCLRVRSIAEHSVVNDRNDPWQNTRTTYANFFEKILFAPLHVNYHVEHHLLIHAPSYNYPKMHRLLKERGFYNKGLLEPNYINIIRLAISKKGGDVLPT
jgi:fatty acid desaturase